MGLDKNSNSDILTHFSFLLECYPRELKNFTLGEGVRPLLKRTSWGKLGEGSAQNFLGINQR